MQEALEVVRRRCWEYRWVAGFDVQKAFDEIDHESLLKAIRKHNQGAMGASIPWALV